MDEIITFELALIAFVIAMFLIMTWLYPTEEAITDALNRKHKHRINLLNETICRGVPEYNNDKSVLGFGSPPVGDALDDNLIEDIDEEWIDYHDDGKIKCDIHPIGCWPPKESDMYKKSDDDEWEWS